LRLNCFSNQNMKKYIVSFLIIVLSLSSCMSKKKIVYLQGNQDVNNTSLNYEPILQRDDRIAIIVSSVDSEASIPFNLNTTQTQGSTLSQYQTSYLIDTNGTIDFPIIGRLKVEGYTIEELKVLLKLKLTTYFKVEPVVNVTLLNFKVTVLGAVNSPGVKKFDNNRVTLLDAIAISGDLTIFGKRQNILLIRDFQGIKTFNRVDITKADFVNSPFYYLDQNDLVYVEERKAKIDASAFPNLPLVFSILGFLTTIILLVTK
jgi:polysaccharide export outer membrane protein